MFESYLKTALRNLARHRVYAAINIIGLSISLAFCILTFLFVHNEWTYDVFHTNADRIYRVYIQNPNHIFSNMPSPFAPAFAESFPKTQTVRFVSYRIATVGQEEPSIKEKLSFADPTFFEIFSFPLINGDPTKALQNTYSAVITEKIAQKYFGQDNPLGKDLTINWADETRSYTISGVAKNVPKNSSIQFDILLPFAHSHVQESWFNYNTSAYVLLPQNVRPTTIEQQLPQWVTPWWGKKSDNTIKLQPLTQMHLDPTIPGRDVSNPAYAYVLAGIALLILFIACVNFTTLTMGRQATRTREVGLRKVVGAKPLQIAYQFIGESLLLIGISVIVGICLAELTLPTFNTLSQKSFELSDGLNTTTFAFLVFLISFVGITAGGYPALILSRLHPTQIITHKLQTKTGNRFGTTLTIFQFTLSICLVIGALNMAKQLDFLRSKPLGYQTEHIVAVSTYTLQKENENLPRVYQEVLSQSPAIVNTTWLNHSLNNNIGSNTDIRYQGGERIHVENLTVDENTFKTLDMILIRGRAFSKEFPTDKKESVIINNTLSERLGLKNPIGETIKISNRVKTVVGVVQDFHFKSLHHKIQPAILNYDPNQRDKWRLVIRIHPDNISNTIAFLKETWTKLAPAEEFYFEFIDDALNKQYHKEENWNQIVQYATLFAIFIAGLGAFGLAALATTRRTKEIGIRKILGASPTQIISLLSRQFIHYIIIASFVAFPITHYALNQWLQTFAYRITLEINGFLLGSVTMLLVVLITVSTQALKAARANPIDALRTE